MKQSKLTITPSQALQLQALGIDAPAVLYHFTDQDLLTTPAPIWEIMTQEYVLTFKNMAAPHTMVPAWTKEEVDVMIGPKFTKPDLYEPGMVGRATNPYRFPVFFPDKLVDFESGAQASAEFLIFLLKMNKINPIHAVDRYKRVYKP
jgi:hypothetical protein